MLVSALIAPRGASARILAAARAGVFELTVSPELVAEYRSVLAYPELVRRTGIGSKEADVLVAGIAATARLVDPLPGAAAPPDPGDAHLWALLEAVPDGVLVTGDRALLAQEPPAGRLMTPRAFLDEFGAGFA